MPVSESVQSIQSIQSNMTIMSLSEAGRSNSSQSSIGPGMAEIQPVLLELAIKDLPEPSAQLVHDLINDLESAPYMPVEQAFQVATEVMPELINQPKALSNVFKYLNCRFMIDEQIRNTFERPPSEFKSSLQGNVPALHRIQNQHQLLRGRSNQDFKVSAVLTAHPTQLNRPESSEKLLRTLPAVLTGHHSIPQFCTEFWEVAGPRPEKPKIEDETQCFRLPLKHMMEASARTHKVVRETLIDQGKPPIRKPIIEAGNWISGDRDGNPTIQPKDLENAVKQSCSIAFELYDNKLGLEKDYKPDSLPNLFIKAGNQAHLNALRNRLNATRQHLLHAKTMDQTFEKFANPDEMIEHLNELRNALDWGQLHALEVATLNRKLDQLQLSLQAFGFHGASTDIRQNSEINERTVHLLLQGIQPALNYLKMNEAERVAVLDKILNDHPGFELPAQVTSNQQEIQTELDFLGTYKGLRDKFGEQALQNIITANTETPSDMLEVCVLLKYAGLCEPGTPSMNVVPLIETVPDMKNALDLMETMLQNKWYRGKLSAEHNVQQVMLGYSDSMRSNGITAATWEVHKKSSELTDLTARYDVKIHPFHGRGGTSARGARVEGYAKEIDYQDGASLFTGLRQTEQGEEVLKKFGNRSLADKNIVELLTTTLEATTRGADTQIKTHEKTMDWLADKADETYRDLYTPELANFLKKTTPLDYVAFSNAGSRPASRRADLQGNDYLMKLRAIPYVAAWNQSGSHAVAYYGLGKAIHDYINQPDGHATARLCELQGMYENWPFFSHLIDSSATALRQSNMEVASRYAALSPENSTVFEKVRKENQRTEQMIDLVTFRNSQLETQPIHSLRLFSHAAQVELLKRANQSPSQLDQLKNALVMSIQTLANALGRFG